MFGHRDGILDIFFNHHTGDRTCPYTTITCIFNKNRNGNFRIITWSKCKKYSVIFTMWVLCCTRFSTHFKACNSIGKSSSFAHVDSSAQSFDYWRIIFSIYTGGYFFCKFFFDDLFIPNSFNKMRAVIKSSIRYNGHDICHL
ncbi:hypothetical protein D3C72_1417460 [compost metagenome]